MQHQRGFPLDLLNHNLHFHKIPLVIRMHIKSLSLFCIILVLNTHTGARNQFSVRTITHRPQG